MHAIESVAASTVMRSAVARASYETWKKKFASLFLQPAINRVFQIGYCDLRVVAGDRKAVDVEFILFPSRAISAIFVLIDS